MGGFSAKSLRSRSVLGTLSISLTLLIVLSLLLLTWFRSEMIRNYHRLSEAALGHIEAAFRQSLNDARYTAGRWYQSADGKSLCVDPETSFVDHMPFINSARSVLENTGYYHSAALINRQRKVALYLGTAVSIPADPESALLAGAANADAKNQPFLWSAPRQYDPLETLHYLAVPIADFSFSSDRFFGMAVLNIDLKQLRKSLLAEQDTTEFQICILNQDGVIVCHSDESLLGVNVSDQPWTVRMLENSGRFSAEVDGKDYEFQVGGTENGFTAAILSRSAAQAGNLNHTTNIMIMVILVAAFLQIWMILLISRRIFDPFHSVVSQMKQAGSDAGATIPDVPGDEVAFLRQYNSAVTDRIQQLTRSRNYDFIARNLLLGSNQEAVSQMLTQSEILLPQRPYRMILAAVEGENDAATMRDYDLMRETLIRLLQESLVPAGRESCLEISLKRMLFFAAEEREETLTQALAGVEEKLRESAVARACFVISGAFSDAGTGCVTEFQRMNATLKTALLLGRETVRMDQAWEMPSRSAEAFVEAVRDGNEEACEKAFSEWAEAISCVPYPEFLSRLRELAVRACGPLPKAVEQELNTLITRDELNDWIKSLLQKETGRKTGTLNRTTSVLMEETVDYIRNNPDDSEMNVNMLAERVHITPAYFGKLFQEFTGVRTLDYILQVRMERAKTLLVTELHMDISEVARQVGYRNSAYFTTAFRKYTGMAPSRYRENALNSGQYS